MRQLPASARALTALGYRQANAHYFDTLWIEGADAASVRAAAEKRGINFRYADGGIGIAFDETVSDEDAQDVVAAFAEAKGKPAPSSLAFRRVTTCRQPLRRTTSYLTHPVFNSHHSETQMMRYIKTLERKDVGLDTSMIPLGSCTMKLNAASEMIPVSWPEFAGIHPFAPAAQLAGYQQIFRELEVGIVPDHRLCRRIAAAELRGPGRVRGPDDDPGLSPRSRPARPQRRPHPVVGARHQSGERGDGRPESRRRCLRHEKATSTWLT